MFQFRYILIFVLLCSFFSCNSSTEDESQGYSSKQIKQQQDFFVNSTKYLVKKDAELIESFVERHQWNMQCTKTGLWYEVYHKGTGQKAEPKKIATISYTIHLLDGTLCYKVDSLQAKSFKITQGNVESGLEEGILLLREGDKARFIMPPYLAHGLIGDQDKIPKRATIVYDLTVLKISEN